MKEYIMKKQKENKEKTKKVIVFPEVKTSWEIYRITDGIRLELCDSEEGAKTLLSTIVEKNFDNQNDIDVGIRPVNFRKDRKTGEWLSRPTITKFGLHEPLT